MMPDYWPLVIMVMTIMIGLGFGIGTEIERSRISHEIKECVKYQSWCAENIPDIYEAIYGADQ